MPGDVDSVEISQTIKDIKFEDLKQFYLMFFLQNDIKDINDPAYQEVYQSYKYKANNLIIVTTGLEDNNIPPELADFRAYPNPVAKYLTMDFSKELSRDYKWRIIDQRGIMLTQGTVLKGTKKAEIDVSRIPNGLHILLIGNDDSLVLHRKIIVLH